MMKRSAALLLIASLLQPVSIAKTIKIGMSAAFTGPAQALGNGVKEGIKTYFAKTNANGGV
ncbi:hypothetical protein MJH12_19835, partial [bacterium]|nr:hypothetical protein [bacterium]